MEGVCRRFGTRARRNSLVQRVLSLTTERTWINDKVFSLVGVIYGVHEGPAEERLRSFVAAGDGRPDEVALFSPEGTADNSPGGKPGELMR